MNQNYIENLIFSELEKSRVSKNFHGVNQKNITEYLVKPVKKIFLNTIENGVEEHWVVFDENKNNDKQGYLIFYSESDDSFGLGTKTNLKGIKDAGTFIGIYGSLVDTINSM